MRSHRIANACKKWKRNTLEKKNSNNKTATGNGKSMSISLKNDLKKKNNQQNRREKKTSAISTIHLFCVKRLKHNCLKWYGCDRIHRYLLIHEIFCCVSIVVLVILFNLFHFIHLFLIHEMNRQFHALIIPFNVNCQLFVSVIEEKRSRHPSFNGWIAKRNYNLMTSDELQWNSSTN